MCGLELENVVISIVGFAMKGVANKSHVTNLGACPEKNDDLIYHSCEIA